MQPSAVACLGAPTKLAVTPVAHSTPRPAQQPGPPRQNRSGSRLPGPCAHQHGSSSSSAAANRRRRMCARVLPGAGDASALPQEDASIRVKIMLAESSGRLDLSECGLQAVPAAVFELEGLEELSLAGNQLEQLPPEVGQLTALKRLQLAGNSLQALPESIGSLISLEGIWLHGNQLGSLPQSITALGSLTQLSLAGNRLQALPESVGALSALRELSLAGNALRDLPPSLGQLAALTKLSLHGNQLEALPSSVSGLEALEELWLQGNPPLAALPPELGQLPRLKHLSAADCSLERVPPELGHLPQLQSLSLYGNQLAEVPPGILQAPNLKYVWLEANPLTPAATRALLEAAPSAPALSSLGLDRQQLEGAPPSALAAAGQRLRASSIHGSEGHGYFKLETARAAPAAGSAASSAGSSGSSAARGRVLVVSFGSAPGTPNWGGVLGKVRAKAVEAGDGGADFDVAYIVDPHRSWYRGGDEGYHEYEQRLEGLTSQYESVVFIGDSMGATAALLFSHLATSVHAFCPQVCLASSSIRPGQPAPWFGALRDRVLASVAASSAETVVHVGNWQHDLYQARVLPPDRVRVQIYSVDSHRLALYLDRRGRLEQVIRGAVLQEMGLPTGNVRLANLL